MSASCLFCRFAKVMPDVGDMVECRFDPPVVDPRAFEPLVVVKDPVAPLPESWAWKDSVIQTGPQGGAEYVRPPGLWPTCKIDDWCGKYEAMDDD